MPDTRPHGSQHGHNPQDDEDDLARLLDLDAEVLVEHLATIVEWLPIEDDPRQIVDLGCGTGAGTFALLDRFQQARITAVDSSAGHLQRLRDKAGARGVLARVTTVETDLDDDVWPDLGSPDLVWASASMHHMADPDRALRKVHDTLAPNGLFAVVELAGSPYFMSEDAPEDRPGLEARCHAASDRDHAERMPHRGADWGPKLADAGFLLDGERVLTVNVEGAGDDLVGAYALASLRRLRSTVAEALESDDLVALDGLLDTGGPRSIARRDDLVVRTERAVWTARRHH